MRILILGGTVFLGPHVIDAARARGHAVAIFHRGRHPADGLAAGVERFVGDRTRPEDLAALAARGPWDAVVDTCGYVPRHVRASAEALRGRAGRYVFVSTLSVYAETFGAADEDGPLAPPVAADVETVTGETYGPLKAACEAAARDVLGGAAVVVRPGLIVGPRDPSDRYTWWVRRIARAGRGGRVLAPGDGARLVQVVDVRDLAEFVVTLAERGGAPAAASGAAAAPAVFNVAGSPVRLDAFLAAIAAGTGAAPDLVWVPEAKLAAAGVRAWSDLPVWIDGVDQRTGTARALAAGLTLRDPVETARATWEWDRTRDPAKPLLAGLAPDREAALLAGA